MKWLLTLLEFIEFIVTPFGLAVGLWAGFYFPLVQLLNFNLEIASLLPAVLAINLYFALTQLSD
ncbi:MAG: hypothetical protein KME27_11580 [Lyngbya sp. HA4199-MV5]|nr:hypothetical protein [Lyngbya sp. HA4199-MV5]